jgi:AcrR family transcriptional regulator
MDLLMAATEQNARTVRAPQQARAKRTRAALLAAGARSFSERGYAATTSAGIAEAAGVATGSFYQYFADKDALLCDIARESRMSIADRSLEPLEHGSLGERVIVHMRALVAMVMAHHRDDPGLHAVLTERRHCDPELDALTSAAERALVQRVAALLARWRGGACDPLATAFVLFGMVEGAIHAHVLGASVVDDDRFSDALVQAMMRVAMPEPNGD